MFRANRDGEAKILDDIEIYRVIDHCFSFRSSDTALALRLHEVFAHCIDTSSSVDGAVDLVELTRSPANDGYDLRTSDNARTVALRDVVRLVVSAINVKAAQNPTQGTAVLHAGAASGSAGPFVFPGRSGSGKSTLVASLLELGWSYLADELVAVRPGSVVEGYPKALTLKPGSWDALEHDSPALGVAAGSADVATTAFVEAEYFGAEVKAGVVGPSAIVFPTFDVQTPDGVIDSLSPGASMLQLLECAYVPLESSAFDSLAQLGASTPGFSLRYGGRAQAIECLRLVGSNVTQSSINRVDVAVAVSTPHGPWLADYGDELVAMNPTTGASVLLDGSGRSEVLADDLSPELGRSLAELGVLPSD